MSGRTPAEAVATYVDALQRSVSCVTKEILRAAGYTAAGSPHSLLLARGSPVPLTSDVLALALEVRERYVFQESAQARAQARWTVRVVEYSYALRSPETHGELLAFHYHPHVLAIEFPHLHIGSALLTRPGLAGMHVPTGWVGLEAVIALTIRDLGAVPPRPDWSDVLADCAQALAETRARG